MAVYISIVSHGHAEVIRNIDSISHLSKYFNVIVKSNIPGDNLTEYLSVKNAKWIDSDYNMGFGANNNYIYNYCNKVLDMKSNDYFIVMNPDIFVEPVEIKKLIGEMEENKISIASINLFLDINYTKYDDSIRKFPTLIDFIASFFGLKNEYIYEKKQIKKNKNVDWAAGSFLAFLSSHYQELEGFNENYFMYCEDIDICYRSNQKGNKLVYYPNIKAIHYAQHASKKILSKHFLWHIKNAIRFLLSKKLRLPQSSLIKE